MRFGLMVLSGKGMKVARGEVSAPFFDLLLETCMPLLLLLPHEFSLLDRLARGGGAGMLVERVNVEAARALIGYRLVRQTGSQLHLTLRGQTVLESATLRQGIVLEMV